MKVGLAVFTSIGFNNADSISSISSLSCALENYFSEKDYGSDIKSFIIGIVCVAPQFEQFYKEEKPQYTKGKKVINPDGIPFTLEDNFEYSIKVDFDSLNSADDLGVKCILAGDILTSLVVFNKMKSKIKDFDMHSFRADLEEYFKSHNLMD